MPPSSRPIASNPAGSTRLRMGNSTSHASRSAEEEAERLAAATRLQRVWRKLFKPFTTKALGMEFLDMEHGIPIEKGQNMR